MTDRYYKLTTIDGWDLYTGNTINYREALAKGTPVKPVREGTPELCTATVVHASNVARDCFHGLWREKQGLDKLAMFEVAGAPLVSDPTKAGFAELSVVRELPREEWLGLVYGGDPAGRVAEANAMVADAKEIAWAKPKGPIDRTVIEALGAEHMIRLAPYAWAGRPVEVLPVRIVGMPADAADASADAAADTAAAASASAASAASDAAAASADAADAADADADADAAASAAASASAASARVYYWLRWYVRPRLYQLWRWHVVYGDSKPNPWIPPLEIWRTGAVPIGAVNGEYVVWIPGGGK